MDDKTSKANSKKALRAELERMATYFTTALPGETHSLMQKWIEKVARKNPGKAADLALACCEYITPKQARVESVGDDGGPLVVRVMQTPPTCPHCKIRHDPAGPHVSVGGTLQ